MNGEPFLYGSRLTVRQLLELREHGYTLTEILKDHPELRVLGHRLGLSLRRRSPRPFADFFEADGSLAGPA